VIEAMKRDSKGKLVAKSPSEIAPEKNEVLGKGLENGAKDLYDQL
jgi:hypothetical protein